MPNPSVSLVAQFNSLLRVTAGHHQPDQLRAKRLMALGFKRTCGRCEGSGQHSFNGRDSICYQCRGACFFPQDMTPALLDLVGMEVAVGALDEYLTWQEVLRERNRLINNPYKVVRQLWEDSGVDPMYDWRKAADQTTNPTGPQRDRQLADINLIFSRGVDQANKLADKLRCMPGQRGKLDPKYVSEEGQRQLAIDQEAIKNHVHAELLKLIARLEDATRQLEPYKLDPNLGN